MIDRTRLLADLRGLLRRLEADLLERSESDDVPEVGRALSAEYREAKDAGRTGDGYEVWRVGTLTQIAAAWALSGVFVRFLEDNGLIDPPRIAGPGERLGRARDEHEVYFRSHPTETDREYLLRVFDDMAKLPGAADLFGPHNPVRDVPNALSGDAAGELIAFFRRVRPETGGLVHDFTDPAWDTRFLGDLYQDLSEAARKRYALLQTPGFVEEFILDRTLDPAIDEFGLRGFRMIDPACGSGHFLLGAFARILDRWQRTEPATNVRELARRALESVNGVDLNPYAVAIARFRLLLAAMNACGIRRLAGAPDFRLNLACGDSLLHGSGAAVQLSLDGPSPIAHIYRAEDLPELQRILQPGRYHAVVANPPYITPKDRALNDAYRQRYSSCHMKYSLAVPFMERIFSLAVPGGCTGQITANSFMKREFGKKLIEELLPKLDLTHVIDTSGAYIPGHGTPTVILFGRNRRPIAGTIRAVMGIRGEPATPDDPSRALVWSAILDQVDRPGSVSTFVSVVDSPRGPFHKHPWSIGGGGAAELKERIDGAADARLGDVADAAGFASFPGLDDAFVMDQSTLKRGGCLGRSMRRFIYGEIVRDYWTASDTWALVPYTADSQLCTFDHNLAWCRRLWSYRTCLANVMAFGGKTRSELGDNWWAWYRWIPERYRNRLSIVFAFVATHNHFVLDRGGSAFNRHAPVIKLPTAASENDHLGLLGLLNSSSACFWIKQVSHNKGSSVDQHGARQTTVAFENFWEHDSTKLRQIPLPGDRPTELARQLDALAQELTRISPPGLLACASHLTAASVAEGRAAWERTRERMIALQEELDWECYRLYDLMTGDLTCADPPPIRLGERAFEIAMARRMAAGEIETTWFARHGSTPVAEIPAEWPEAYRRLVERRIALIETDRDVGLIEQPEYKRRWNTEPWESQLERALRTWLLDRLESYFDFDGRMNDAGTPTAQLDVALTSTNRLTDIARRDPEFMRVAELYRDDPAFDAAKLVDELVGAESVPLLPVQRYAATGLRKRAAWEETWDLQRREDAIDARTRLAREDPEFLDEPAAAALKQREVGDVPVPPKYASADFRKTEYWRLRGKLDVPKERWVSFPGCEGPDGAPVIAWAGYDHLQLARAVSAYYVDVLERWGGRGDPRLAPLLAGLIELLPWLKQWHNAVDPEFGTRMGDYFEGFVLDEARRGE